MKANIVVASEQGSGVFVNGRELDGRTYEREDGSYETLDLSEIGTGSVVAIITNKGDKYQLQRLDHDKNTSSLENWRMITDPHDRFGGRALNLTLLEPNPAGQSFLHPGVVLSEYFELGVTDVNKKPGIISNIGRIAAILPGSVFDDIEDGRLPHESSVKV